MPHFSFLAKFLRQMTDPVVVDVVIFRFTPDPLKQFHITSQNIKELIEFLQNLKYYGGTCYDSLSFRDRKTQFGLFFSDGLPVLGKETALNMNFPIYTFTSNTKANFVNLKRWSLKSGGCFFFGKILLKLVYFHLKLGEFFNLNELNFSQRQEVIHRIGRSSFGLLSVNFSIEGKDSTSTKCDLFPNSFCGFLPTLTNSKSTK